MATKKAPQKQAAATKKSRPTPNSRGASKRPTKQAQGMTINKAKKAVGNAVSSASSAVGSAVKSVLPVSLGGESAKAKTPFIGNVSQLTKDNDNFRQVLFTTELSQLVLMSVPPGGEIGSEVHSGIDQVLTIVEGEGETVLNNEKKKIQAGSIIVVPAGARHNFVNTSAKALKLYTVYTPPEHEPGTIHRTKAEADADEKY